MNLSNQIQKVSGARAQAMVEFAIVVSIFALMLFGIFEVGRMIYVYSAVNNASREAVRYGSAIGLDDYGEIKYKHCEGIREMARRSAYFLNLQDSDIEIKYDHGPSQTPFDTCTGDVDSGVVVTSGDRISVKVTANYRPYTRLVPWGQRTFVSFGARTILSYVDMAWTPVAGGPATTSAPGTAAPSQTPTETPTPTLTETATPTPTITGIVIIRPSFTPMPSITLEPSITPTPTETQTPTPSVTPTTVTGCDSVTAGEITIPGNTASMSLTIDNPNPYPLTVKDIQVVWNALTGAPDNELLTLVGLSLGDQFLNVQSSAGQLTITPSQTLTMPASATSILTFLFDNNYANPDGNESILINLSTPGCEQFPIRRP
jgi:Flp pilus assembly protein TadG